MAAEGTAGRNSIPGGVAFKSSDFGINEVCADDWDKFGD